MAVDVSYAADRRNSFELKVIFFILKLQYTHDDVIKWKHFPRYWPFVQGIHQSPMNSPHKGQWCSALMFSLICTWINGWVCNKNPCVWLLWYWSSQGQLAVCNPRGLTAEWVLWVELTEWTSVSKKPFKMGFCFHPTHRMQIQPFNSLKNVSICPRWSPWLRIVSVRSLRSVRLDTVWLVKSVTYFDLIG